jgi:3-deoxy-manno-octulosonate cytidylyltransferase (CMP-KDO synthetase)
VSAGPGAPAGRNPRAVAVIPARIASTRLPRKMLLAETGRCLFEHTARSVQESRAFARVVLATDDAEIAAAAARAGIEALMTRPDHASGTDRVCEAWNQLAAAGERADVVVNIQGDEPEIDPAALASLVAVFADPAIEMATLAAPLRTEEEWTSSAVVKLVCDAAGDALYFSRAPVPARGHGPAPGPAHGHGVVASGTDPYAGLRRRHIGVYAFAPAALARFAALPRGRLEAVESLEQLRWLEAGGKIRVVAAARAPAGIDTREDYERFVTRVRGLERTRSG